MREFEMNTEVREGLDNLKEAMNRPYSGTLLSGLVAGGANISTFASVLSETDIKTTETILQAGKLGYAYLYPADGSQRQEYLFSMTPENIANFIGGHQFDAQKIVLTDQMDCLILNTIGGFINHCPDKNLLFQIIPQLAPIQQLEKEPTEFPIVSRTVSDMYFEVLSAVEMQQATDQPQHGMLLEM